MEDPRLRPPAVELRRGLVPKLPDQEPAGDPRDFLKREAENHRRACLAREAGWEAEVFEALTAADAVSARVGGRCFVAAARWEVVGVLLVRVPIPCFCPILMATFAWLRADVLYDTAAHGCRGPRLSVEADAHQGVPLFAFRESCHCWPSRVWR